MFVLVMINEPARFELLRVDCIYIQDKYGKELRFKFKVESLNYNLLTINKSI